MTPRKLMRKLARNVSRNLPRSLMAGALLAVGTAGASLPPLPDAMPYDDGAAGYGDPPLPGAGAGVIDNPFADDGTAITTASVDEADERSRVAGLADSGDDGDRGEDRSALPAEHRVGSRASPAGAAAVRRSTSNVGDDNDADPARGAGPSSSQLEGPPTPLPPAQRLSTPPDGAAAGAAAVTLAPGERSKPPVEGTSGAVDRTGQPPTPSPPTPLATQPVTQPATPLATPRLSLSTADNRPITLNFQHADVTAVIGAFARFTGLNVVASERVRGFVTLHLDKVPWREAFDTLLDVGNLAMERRGNVIWVAPVAELAAREKQRFETHARAADLEPLASRTFELHYAKADDVRRLLTASGAQRVLSRRGSASADVRTNLLFVTDLAARLAQLAQLLEAIDRPTRQVLIEARIVEGEEGFSRNLGARLKLAATREGQPTGLVSGKDDTLLDLSARPISGFDAATAGLTLFVAQATRLLNVELSALETEGHGKIVSSPRVVTADRIKAIVEQGQELPYQAKVSQGVSGVQFRRASLKLEVEPQVTPTGKIVLDLDVAKDSVGEETAAGPAINTKHVRTRVEVEDGGTVSIGGIYANDDRDDVTEVPLLGKIPVLGGLFRHRAHRRQRSELVIFITPRVVASGQADG